MGGRLRLTRLAALENTAVNPIRRQREVVKADTGGVRQRIRQRWRDRIDRGFAHRFRAERTEGVIGVGEIHFGVRNIGESWDAVMTERRVNDASSLVKHHLFVQRPAQCLRHRTFDLRAALHGIDDHAAVCSVHTLQDNDLTRDAVHGDAKALDLKRDATRGAVRLADHFQRASSLPGGMVQVGQRQTGARPSA